MSVQRYPVYVWSSGPEMNLWAWNEAEGVRPLNLDDFPDYCAGFSMPIEEWDALVMRYLKQRHFYVDVAAGDTEPGDE